MNITRPNKFLQHQIVTFIIKSIKALIIMWIGQVRSINICNLSLIFINLLYTRDYYNVTIFQHVLLYNIFWWETKLFSIKTKWFASLCPKKIFGARYVQYRFTIENFRSRSSFNKSLHHSNMIYYLLPNESLKITRTRLFRNRTMIIKAFLRLAHGNKNSI